jgi:hypothetical protein
MTRFDYLLQCLLFSSIGLGCLCRLKYLRFIKMCYCILEWLFLIDILQIYSIPPNELDKITKNTIAVIVTYSQSF